MRPGSSSWPVLTRREDSPAAFPDRQGALPAALFHPTPVHPKAQPSPDVRIYDASTGKLIRKGTGSPGPPGSLQIHTGHSSFRYVCCATEHTYWQGFPWVGWVRPVLSWPWLPAEGPACWRGKASPTCTSGLSAYFFVSCQPTCTGSRWLRAALHEPFHLLTTHGPLLAISRQVMGRVCCLRPRSVPSIGQTVVVRETGSFGPVLGCAVPAQQHSLPARLPTSTQPRWAGDGDGVSRTCRRDTQADPHQLFPRREGTCRAPSISSVLTGS